MPADRGRRRTRAGQSGPSEAGGMYSEAETVPSLNHPPETGNWTLLVSSASCGLENDQDKLHY